MLKLLNGVVLSLLLALAVFGAYQEFDISSVKGFRKGECKAWAQFKVSFLGLWNF
jgi:hypothetical protein